MAETIEGGCLCGDIRYRIEAEQLFSATCQCRSCRRAAAAPVVPWIHVLGAAVTFTAGKPVEYRSSPEVTRTFCGRCGTPLTYSKTAYENAIDVTTCSLDDPEAHPPVVHLWTSHALSWTNLGDGLPCFEEDPPGG